MTRVADNRRFYDALWFIEHVDDEDGAMAELVRLARPGATLLLSTPLHPSPSGSCRSRSACVPRKRCSCALA